MCRGWDEGGVGGRRHRGVKEHMHALSSAPGDERAEPGRGTRPGGSAVPCTLARTRSASSASRSLSASTLFFRTRFSLSASKSTMRCSARMSFCVAAHVWWRWQGLQAGSARESLPYSPTLQSNSHHAAAPLVGTHLSRLQHDAWSPQSWPASFACCAGSERVQQRAAQPVGPLQLTV